MRVDLTRGMDLRLEGAPEQNILGRVASDSVALQLGDYRGVKPKLLVEAGDPVRLGQPLVHDRDMPELVCTSFVAGRVKSIKRGPRRQLEQIVLVADGAQSSEYRTFTSREINKMGAEQVRLALLNSGLWTALRARPFESIASPAIKPRALFVTAIDSNPLAPDPDVVLRQRSEDFLAGVRALAQLAIGKTYVCVAAGTTIPAPDHPSVQRIEFAGPHPSGLPGTHLHAVGLPVGPDADLWHIGYQDVVACGRLLLRGTLDCERVISLAGPGIERPGLLQVRLGTRLAALPVPRQDATQRVIAGPLLGLAREAEFMGRFDLQVSVFPADASVPPGAGIWRNAARRLLAAPRTAPSLPAAARPRTGMLPVETFERIWPFRTPPAALLRALLIGNPDDAVQLGCLGLAEEDLALCNLVCPAGQDYAAALRNTLASIESQH